MSDHLLEHGTRKTPQSEPILGSDQVENSAGGFVWEIDDVARLRRFLILGSEGGSYYASERKLTLSNVEVVARMAKTDGIRLVDEIVAISDAGRAPKNEQALYALAAAISFGETETKIYAGKALPKVARIGTHLYHFVAYVESMRGWGSISAKAVSEWYLGRELESLAYDAVKYRQRDGWSHRDLLRLSHPIPADAERDALFAWICGVEPRGVAGEVALPPMIVEGYERAQKATSPEETASLVHLHRLPREALLTEHLTDPVVWRALLDVGMPIGALVRNLANMTRLAVLEGDARARVLADLSDPEKIRKSRIHPLAILMALSTYASGKGFRGTNTWRPIASVIDALDAAFYLAFDNVEPTGKKHLIGVDVSGSMDWPQSKIAGTNLTSREAAAAMALVTVHAEEDVEVIAFTGGGGYGSTRRQVTPVGVSRRQRLDDVVALFRQMPAGGTDCALPFVYADQEKTGAEAFLVMTDNETWAGGIHPKQALDQYRQRNGIAARSAIVGFVSNPFSIADPNDPGMMDVAGFDTAAPALVADFFGGRI